MRWILILFFLGLPWTADARASRANAFFNETLSRHIGTRFANALAADDLFQKQELPTKLALGLFVVDVPDAHVTGRTFTDQILEGLLVNAKILVVNQDIAVSEKMNFSLQSYDEGKMLAERGNLLGATDSIVGVIKEHWLSPKPGKVKKAYALTATVTDVHSRKVRLEKTFLFSENGKLLKDKTDGR